MMLLYLYTVLGLTLLAFIIGFYIELRRSKDKKKTLLKNLAIAIPILTILFLFGPLFTLSPIKLGHTVVRENGKTMIYPNKLSLQANEFFEVIEQSENIVQQFYEIKVPTQYLLIGSGLDMIRFGGAPLEKAGGASAPGGIFIRNNKIDAGVITHELSHRYLSEKTKKLTPYFPRWFDEGLATYLGHTSHMERYTNPSVLQESLRNGRYQQNLDYWNGILGYLRWVFPDCKKRPLEVYTQSYFLTHFLIEEYGQNKIVNLINECQVNSSFEQAFQKTYQISTPEFHQNFLTNVTPHH